MIRHTVTHSVCSHLSFRTEPADASGQDYRILGDTRTNTSVRLAVMQAITVARSPRKGDIANRSLMRGCADGNRSGEPATLAQHIGARFFQVASLRKDAATFENVHVQGLEEVEIR